MSQVVSIAYTPDGIDPEPADHYARVPLAEARLVVGHGIEGDCKGGGRKRQLNVMAAETLRRLRDEGFKTAPGEMGEQLVVSGVEVERLAPGDCLRLGAEATIEITSVREPCTRFAHIQACPVAAGEGRIGVMARVVVGGAIRVGDPVTLLRGAGVSG